MARSTFAAFVLAALAACAHGRPLPGGRGPGDFVVYRYTGLFTREPVTVRKQVLERRGDRLLVEVAAERGDERRRWVELVADLPGDPADGRVEALWKVEGGERIRLENEGNADLFQLYEWTLVFPETQLREGRAAPCTDTILGRAHACECRSALTTMMGHGARILEHGCPGFPWRRGSVLVTDTDTGEVIQRVEVVDAGPAPAAP